ncbi:MMPL family transporter [Nocardioides sp. SOB77]|uniref:MMPL family transporter n=1 Tax=Nocardioides oceani TaxID=3058369 RepID=A0ABT8FCX0_9ACTN|nr:MMPL family transporter [Nocardioides oceani]MDN4172439.1 MMPL family transporter [Nocardioides oceani]
MTDHRPEHRPEHRSSQRPHPVTSRIVARRTAWLFAFLPLVAALLGLVLLGEGDRPQEPLDQLPRDLDSTLATELEQRLPDEGSDTAVVLWTADEGELDRGALDELRSVAQDLDAVGGGPQGPVSVAEDGTAAIAIVQVASGSATDVSAEVEDLREELEETAPDGVTARATGPAAVQADLAAVFDGANFRLLAVTAGVVALLLVITYRSPVLWLVPLTVVGVADRFAAIASTQVMAALDVAWDESTVGILSVLVFGAGTNYALLLISRYRDELRHVEDRYAAMATALARTAEAVLASATTVVLGLLTLLLSVVPTTRGLGLACAIGVVVAAFFALVVLPAALVLCGRWVFWPKVPRTGQAALVDMDSFWHRVGARVARRPAVFACATVAVIAALTIGLFGISTGLDQDEQFLDEPEAISASTRLAESFPAGLTDPTRVVTTADPQEVARAVEGAEGVASVQPGPQGDGVASLNVVLEGSPGSGEAESAIAAIREAVDGLDDTHVGGTEASAIDAREGAAREGVVILPLILGLVLAALLLLLRSVVAPLILVATVLGTYAASMGAAWWLFTGPLGFSALDESVPLLAFLFLVALGVDYNIFLVTRAREEAAGHGARDGMLRALAATGGVITSAGILLAAVFAVLGVLPLVVLAQLGTIICIGVLLDTLLVRTVLVPAAALLLGDRFWWPRKVRG